MGNPTSERLAVNAGFVQGRGLGEVWSLSGVTAFPPGVCVSRAPVILRQVAQPTQAVVDQAVTATGPEHTDRMVGSVARAVGLYHKRPCSAIASLSKHFQVPVGPSQALQVPPSHPLLPAVLPASLCLCADFPARARTPHRPYLPASV